MSLDTSNRFTPAPTDFDAAVLRKVLTSIANCRAFLCWRAVQRGGRLDKMPCSPVDGSIPTTGNSASQQGRLTLEEAIEAAQRLGVGIGIVPGRAGVVAMDLDEALSLRGVMRESLSLIVGAPDCYLERSPSGIGIRGLLLGTIPQDIGSGNEVGSVGFYYSQTKFVTLTGHHYGGPLDIVEAQGIIDRGAERMREHAASSGVAGHLLGYGGAKDVEIAKEHILSGLALHEPAMFLSAHWARTTNMLPDEIEQELMVLLHNSQAEESRVTDRMKQVPRWTANAVKKFGNDYQKQDNSLDQDEAIHQIRQAVLRMKAKAKEAQAKREEANEEVIKSLERDRVAALRMLELPDTDEVPAMTDYTWAIEEAPSPFTRKLAEFALSGMKRVTPGGALMTALSALSIAARNQYVVMSGNRPTPLNMAIVVVAVSGAGKSHLLGLAKTAGVISETPGSGTLESPQGIHQDLLNSLSPQVRPGRPFSMDNPAPALLLDLDEYGLLLQNVCSDRPDRRIKDSLSYVMQVWPEACGSYRFGGRSDSKKSKPPVHCPYLNVLGMTTPEELALTPTMVTNGFVTRHLFMFEDDKDRLPFQPAGHDYVGSPGIELAEGLDKIATSGCTRAQHRMTNLGMSSGEVQSQFTEIGVIGLARSARRIEFPHELRVMVEAKEQELSRDENLQDLAARYALQVTKIAGLLALASITEQPLGAPLQITEAHVTYAMRLVDSLMRDFVARRAHITRGATSAAARSELAAREAVAEIILKLAHDPSATSDQRIRPLAERGFIAPWVLGRLLRRRCAGREIRAALDYWMAQGVLMPAPDGVFGHGDAVLAMIPDEAYEQVYRHFSEISQ